MRIGIDLDEVVADTMTAMINFHNNKYKTNFKRDDFHSYNFWEVWGGTREEAIKKMFEFYGTDHFNGVIPIAGSVKAINKLKENGHDVFIITGRQNEVIKETEKWIEKHFSKIFSGVHFSNSYNLTGHQLKKSTICKQLGIEIIIEDDIKHSKDLSEAGIKVLLFDQPWNKNELLNENIKRIFSWKDIINEISKG